MDCRRDLADRVVRAYCGPCLTWGVARDVTSLMCKYARPSRIFRAAEMFILLRFFPGLAGNASKANMGFALYNDDLLREREIIKRAGNEAISNET